MAFTEEFVLAKLKMWSDAEDAVATGQSYSIGGRSLQRVNISEIRQQIKYWQKELKVSQGKSGRRVTRVVPRDL